MSGGVAGNRAVLTDGLGHMVNDGARSKAVQNIDVYNLVSRRKENVHPYIMCTNIGDVRAASVFMLATRNIEKGEELFFHYGANYWSEVYEQ